MARPTKAQREYTLRRVVEKFNQSQLKKHKAKIKAEMKKYQQHLNQIAKMEAMHKAEMEKLKSKFKPQSDLIYYPVRSYHQGEEVCKGTVTVKTYDTSRYSWEKQIQEEPELVEIQDVIELADAQELAQLLSTVKFN